MRDWRSLIGNRQLSPEAVDELAQHLEDTYQAAIAGGNNDDAAMRAVEEELAGLDRAARHLDIRAPRIGVLEHLRQFIHIDLRDAFRRLLRAPGFSLVAIVVLAVGLGVNTAIFSLINALLYKPLPVRAPNELVFLYYASYSGGAPYYSGVPLPLYDELAANPGMFRQIAGAGGDSAWVTIDGETQQLSGNVVTPGYFETLGVTAQLGRTFTSEENSAGATPSIVISDDVWTTRFHRDPSIVGKPLRLSRDQALTESLGRDYTIVGVLPAGFNGTGSSAAWLSPSYYVPVHQRMVDSCVPVGMKPFPPRPPAVALVGRLADGVTFDTAVSFTEQSNAGWTKAWLPFAPTPGSHFALRRSRFARIPIDSAGKVVPERLATALVIVSGLVLLIAASNLVGIFMARGVAARADTAIRLSLGAGRWRVARQHLAEGYLLAVVGSIAGLAVAGLLTKLFVAYLPPSRFGGAGLGGSPVALDVAIDGRVWLFALVTCAIVGTAIGLGPARQASKTDVLSSLQLASPTSSRSRRSLRHWIVVPQIAVAVVLLLVTGAVSRTLITSEMTAPGYVPDGLVAVQFQLRTPDTCVAKPDYAEWARRRIELTQRISNALPRIPSIQSAAMSTVLPHEPPLGGTIVKQDEGSTGQLYGVRLFYVTPDYFSTLQIPLIAGRGFTEADEQRSTADGASVVVISRKLAATLWPNQSAVGRVVAQKHAGSTSAPRWAEVVGVAEDVLSPLNDGYPAPSMYVPTASVDRVIARAKSSESDALREISAAIKSADPSVVIAGSGTIASGIGQIRFARRLAIAILGGAALIGLALAAIGLYGVVSYALAQRIREFGIRAALGANYRDLIALVLKEALIVASIGSIIGLAAAYSAIGLISSKLVAIPSVNLGIVIGGPAIVFLAVALACYLPARRAARVDPLVVLRGL